MLQPDEVISELLTHEYVKEHGVPYESLSDECYWENGVNHYERMFDKPMNEGGKPFSGIAYETYGYTVYKDGYQCGDDVTFYPSGKLRRFSRLTENEYYIYCWHENGLLRYFKENHRKDAPNYYRIREYDENGILTKQKIHSEFSFIYDFTAPNDKFEVKWHKNGEFRNFRCLSPTRETFYSYFEYDAAGYPIKYKINPFYSPEYLSSNRYVKSFSVCTFDKKDYQYGI